jgi:aminopeptidase N
MPPNMETSINDNLSYYIKKAHLKFDLDTERILVTATFDYELDNVHGTLGDCLILKGKNIKLIEVKLNDSALSSMETSAPYIATKGNRSLRLLNVPAQGKIQITNESYPAINISGYGLYFEQDILVANCHQYGLQHLTYFLKRHDNTTVITTEMHANITKFPVLLSSGTISNQQPLEKSHNADLHSTTWEDPTPKYGHEFAIVAGNLSAIQIKHSSILSNRSIILKIYAPNNKLKYCHFAVKLLSLAMTWHEKSFARECKTDCYTIVAVPSFSASCIINHNLNIVDAQRIFLDSNVSHDEIFQDDFSTLIRNYFGNQTLFNPDHADIGSAEYLTQLFMANYFGVAERKITTLNILSSRLETQTPTEYVNALQRLLYLSTENSEAELYAIHQWQQMQQHYTEAIMTLMQTYATRQFVEMPIYLIDIISDILNDPRLSNINKANIISLPHKHTLIAKYEKVNLDLLFITYNTIEELIANLLEDKFLELYASLKDENSIGQTCTLRNICLYFLAKLCKDEYSELCKQQLYHGENITDKCAAAQFMCNNKFSHHQFLVHSTMMHFTVINQALPEAEYSVSLSKVTLKTSEVYMSLEFALFNKALTAEQIYTMFKRFAHENLELFHDKEGGGYHLFTQAILLLDPINNYYSTDLLSYFEYWPKLNSIHKALINNELDKISLFLNASDALLDKLEQIRSNVVQTAPGSPRAILVQFSTQRSNTRQRNRRDSVNVPDQTEIERIRKNVSLTSDFTLHLEI